MGQSIELDKTTLKVTYKELMPFADYEIRKFEVHNVSSPLIKEGNNYGV